MGAVLKIRAVAGTVAVVAATLTLMLLPTGASASPDCSATDLSTNATTVANIRSAAFVDPISKKPKLPTSIIVGKTFDFELYDWNVLPTDDATDRITWSWVSAGGQFTYPQSKSFAVGYDSWKNRPVLNLQFGTGDGPGKVVVNSIVDYYDAYWNHKFCKFTYESDPIAAVTPKIGLLRGYPHAGDDGIDFRFNGSECVGQVISLKISSGGQSRTATSGPGCAWPDKSLRGLAGLTVSSDSMPKEDDLDWNDSDYGVDASFYRERRGAKHFAYSVRVDDEQVRAGSFTYKMRFKKGRRARLIWDYQFDDYVNICINRNRKIRAKNGHLYCVRKKAVASEWLPDLARFK